MRIEKRKLPSVGRINKHHERQKEEYKSNPDIQAQVLCNPLHLAGKVVGQRASLWTPFRTTS